MAEPEDLTIPQPDAGVAFRLEMWVTNVLLGYWWVLVGAVVVALVGVLVYGFIDNRITDGQQTASKQIDDALVEVQTQLLDPDKVLQYEQIQGQDGKPFRWGHVIITPSFEAVDPPSKSLLPLELAIARFGREGVEKEPVLIEAADKLMGVHAAQGGITGGQAALYASEMYEIAGNAEGQQKALQAAATSPAPPVAFAATSRLAQVAAGSGDVDTAETTLRPWIKEEKGFFGQQAAYDLGRIYESVDRPTDAEAVYRELLNTWPTTAFRDAVDERLEGMGVDALPLETPEGGAEPAPEPAPEPTPAPEGEGSE